MMRREDWDSYTVLTPGDMRRLEDKAFALGVPGILLMEHAAMAVVDELEKALGGGCRDKSVLFLCGTGNNGGDGLAAARLFLMRGGLPTVWLYGEPKTKDAKTNLKWLDALDVPILNLGLLAEDKLPILDGGPKRHYDAYVDALLGTGFRGKPEGLLARMMLVPCHDFFFSPPFPPVIAIDIPSGIDGKTGDTPGEFVRADVTVTLSSPKPGLYLTKEREAVGKIVVADIGLWDLMPANSGALGLDDPELNCETLTPAALQRLAQRPVNAHKGDCGRVLIYAGSLGMAGAAAMCAKAAVTAGAGLTTIACPKEIIPVLQTLVPNAMCANIEEAAQNPPPYDVLAVGCGLGQSEEVWENIRQLYDPEKPAVWDADALNMLAKHPMKLGEKTVITPHIGEAARLLGADAEVILKDRLAAARKLTEKYGCVTVLKSDVSVICADIRQGQTCYLNAVGSPALAKGGSGDALTGILAAVMAGWKPIINPYQTGLAAALSCLWHGMAGLTGEEIYGQRELTTEELIACLHDAERWGLGQRPAPACWRG